MISRRRWSLRLVDGISRNLYRWNRRLSVCGRRISVSTGLLGDSASLSLSVSLSISSTIPPPSRSPRRLCVSLALHDGSLHLSLRPVAIIHEIKPKSKAKFFPLYVWIIHFFIDSFVVMHACVVFVYVWWLNSVMYLSLFVNHSMVYVSVFVIIHASELLLVFVCVSICNRDCWIVYVYWFKRWCFSICFLIFLVF